MLTGVEIAGLVLAMFPLIVEGLKSWKEGAESLKTWRKTRQTLRQYVMKAENQRVIFENTIEQLLSDVVQSPEHLAEMFRDPSGSFWRDTKHEEHIKSYLDRSYDQFIDTITKMNLLLAQIMEKLGIHQSELSYDDMSRLEREIFGWKMMIGKEALMDNLNEIERANKFLQQTITQSFKLEPARRKRRAKNIVNAVKTVRKQATSLYNALFQDDCWKCACKDRHVASLRLEARPHDQTTMPLLFKLRVVLSAGEPGCRDWVGAVWRDLDVKSNDTGALKIDTSQDSQTQWAYKSMTKRSDLAINRGVRFVIDGTPPEITRLTLEVSSNKDIDLQQISNLCTAIRQGVRYKNEVGFLVDPSEATNTNYKHNLYITSLDDSTEIRTKSLASMLTNARTSQLGLSRDERLQIAVNLASSVLQLEATPWLKQGWRSSDISFYDFGVGKHTTQNRSLAIDPYLSWRLGHAIKEVQISGSENSLLKSHGIRNTRLLSLAFVLIELSFGKTLEELATAEDQDANEVVSRWKTAIRVYENVYYESGPRYGDVVQICLFCSFKMRDVSFENEDFQQAFGDEVVVPLVHDLKAFQGTDLVA